MSYKQYLYPLRLYVMPNIDILENIRNANNLLLLGIIINFRI